MKLLSIEKIQAGLDKEFFPLEPMLSGYRIIRKILPEDKVAKTEATLGVKFPNEFRTIISEFDFGMLTIGPIVFCAKGDYIQELIDLNTSVCWWREGQRPENMIMIGNSDPFTILLDVNSGCVFAMDPEVGWEKSKIIAGNFLDFFRGIGTAMLMRNEIDDRRGLAQGIFENVKSEDLEFWSQLAQ
ncbi:hypothetical protein UNDKW_5930 (plasmid) [Undibacterium sp. KW1]|uniref:SMI1/KNR4 family protein n=1 Tax=Undibacterium sp. KW1 TaxID=2058624 RepID=UPI001331DD7E|nr:SMI1/KNR4 family protein [Undibacterium sp. KW1]BBB64203.1 hypothetical protein UNDKW_5930 [Undibacterium sp. KW1]